MTMTLWILCVCVWSWKKGLSFDFICAVLVSSSLTLDNSDYSCVLPRNTSLISKPENPPVGFYPLQTRQD